MPRKLLSMRSMDLGVIALVPDEWTDDVWTARHIVLVRLAQHFPVAWVSPTPNWRAYWVPRGQRFLRRSGSVEVSPGLSVIEPGLLHPGFFWPTWLVRRMRVAALEQAREVLLASGARRIALYVWRYDYAEALDLIEHDWVVYHIDDEYTFSDKELPIPQAEMTLAQRANRVIIHSPRLFEKKGHLNPNTVHIPNGVDFAAYSLPRAEPTDMASIPHPRIGYTGVIKKQMDFSVLLHLARMRPDWSLVLVGPMGHVLGKEEQLRSLQALPNVHFLGGKAAKDLPGYVQHFDVCLMCYEMNAYTRYIYPLKLHEYLATGKPVVSAPVDSVLPHADVLALAYSPEEWASHVAAALTPEAQGSKATARRQARAREYDWSILVERVSEQFPEA